MEKKKLLLIAVSTGVFLTLVLGASIVIFTPQTGAVSAPAAVSVIGPGRTEIEPVVPAAPAEPEPATEETRQDGVPKVSIIAEDEAQSVKQDVKQEPVKVENTPPAAPKAVIAQPAPKAVIAQPAPKPAVKTKPAGSYWVQIGSYTQKNSADKAKQNLAERGLASVITNSEVQGRMYYRVRIGPYISQTEADYWLKLVRAIDGFEKSQIWKAGT